MQILQQRFWLAEIAGALLALNLGLLVVAAAGAEAPRKPNVIVIVADDLGYGEIVGHGKQDIPTPRINSIAHGGVCLTNGYVTCPVCSPTRAGLLTGRYQQRFGHEFNPGPATKADVRFGLPTSEVTLADRLKKLGYATGLVGKWHLGFQGDYLPQRRGFDEFFGFWGGAHSYIDSSADPANRIMRGDKPVDEPGYLTDALGREAVAFIDRHAKQPFFLYLTFNAVHAPLQGAEKYLARFSEINDEKRRTFAAMLSAMDDNVGLVLDKLAKETLDDNTLIFFIADNGGPTLQTSSGNGPLHGVKGQVWEGGIRVPYFVQWKGKLPAGKTYDKPVCSLDIVPTAVAAAGGSVADGAPLDGVDLVPYLTGANVKAPHESLYWRFGPQWAIRQGDFKLLQTVNGPVQLFDLAKDIGEQHDLAAEKPDVAKQLEQDWKKWDSQLAKPLWEQRGAAQKAKAAKAKGKGKNRRAA